MLKVGVVCFLLGWCVMPNDFCLVGVFWIDWWFWFCFHCFDISCCLDWLQIPAEVNRWVLIDQLVGVRNTLKQKSSSEEWRALLRDYESHHDPEKQVSNKAWFPFRGGTLGGVTLRFPWLRYQLWCRNAFDVSSPCLPLNGRAPERCT